VAGEPVTRRELINGTNFRHAVEFSRSGRAPSRPLRGRSGATRATLPGQLRAVKHDPHHPDSHLVGALVCLVLGGTSARPRYDCLPCGRPSSRLRRANKMNISERAEEESNPLRRSVSGPESRASELAVQGAHPRCPPCSPGASSVTVDTGVRRPPDQTSRTASRRPLASTRPANSARAAS
jgi:hypothetical protein